MNREKVLNALLALNMLFAHHELNDAERQKVIQLFVQLEVDSIKL